MLKRIICGLVLAALLPISAVRAQFPLPAPLYILTSEYRVLRVDPATGGQTVISPDGQPVTDFDIAPDGQWYVYRSSANNAVVISALGGSSGYVLEFDVAAPATSPAQAIAWAPDASAIAYIVPEGVRIATLGAESAGGPTFNTVQGPWIELRWEAPGSLIVSDVYGSAHRLTGHGDTWSVEQADVSPRAQAVAPSYLAPEGVVLADVGVVPGTAGAQAYDWGPPPLPVVAGVVMPRDLMYLAPDASGIDQVWRLPASGAPAAPITAAPQPVLGYDIAPQGIAYVAGGQLWVAGADGSGPRALAMLSLEMQRPRPDWSADGTRLAYSDARGVWVVAADGSQPPMLVAESTPADSDTAPGNVRVYRDPRWSPDGSRLLVTIGLWEGALLGVVSSSGGEVIPLEGVGIAEAMWTPDGRVLAWSTYGMYGVAGMFLLDPAAPAAQPVVLLAGASVLDVAQGADGRWYALVAATPELGPLFARVWVADSLGAPFAPLYHGQAGGFAQQPELVPPSPQGQPAMAAGFETVTYDPTATGPLVVLDLLNGAAVRVQRTEQARALQWGP